MSVSDTAVAADVKVTRALLNRYLIIQGRSPRSEHDGENCLVGRCTSRRVDAECLD